MSAELAALKKIAEAATEGPWEAQEGFKTGGGRVLTPDGYALPGCFNCGENDGVYEEADARHIAAFDPPTALALIDRAEAAESALQRVTREVDHWLDGGADDKWHADQIVMALNRTELDGGS